MAATSMSLWCRITAGASACATSAMCFWLISMLIGQITAPMRQTPSQISSFSRFSSDKQQHPAALMDAAAFQVGGDISGDLIERAEADA